MRQRSSLALALLIALVLTPAPAASAGGPGGCIGVLGTCGKVTTDPERSAFVGLIAISGNPSLLQNEKQLAGSDECDRCSWTLLVECQQNKPGGSQVDCQGSHTDLRCRKGQLAERVFLSRPGRGYGMVGVYCLGGPNRIVPIGAIAKADVGRYLKDVRPPGLDISFDPGTSLAGLATKVSARPGRALRPVPFGGQGVTETIRLIPSKQTWDWGDGQAATFTDASVRTTHTYATGGHLTATVTTTWGATYTVTYQGITLGPYDATGTLTGRQARPVTVVTSTPVLVSHG